MKNLSPEHKQAVESLLGHSISEDESVSIKSFRTSEIIPSRLSGSEHQAALQDLEEYFATLEERLPADRQRSQGDPV